MAKLNPHFQKDFSAGMITGVNENITPRNSVRLGMNVDFDNELGSATVRLGTDIVNAQLVDGKTVLGLHDFQYGTASGKLIAFVNNVGDTQSVGYDVEAGTTITGLTTQTAGLKHRMLTYLDSVFIVNGTDAPASYDGTTVITTGGAFDLANIPFAEPSICIEFLDRVYIAGETANPSRMYYTTVPTAGAVAWTGGDSGSIDLEAEDGSGPITAFGKVPGFLLVFKERSMKRWDFDSAFPESLVNIGTVSQESVISAAGLCAFFSASSTETQGFYVTNGGRPVPISHLRSKNIAKWVKAIPQSFHANVNGWGTENNFYWSIGDVTVDGESYTNVVIRWSVKTGEWAVRSYPSEFRVWSSFVDSSGNNVVVVGDDNGNVLEVNKPNTHTDYVEGGTRPIAWDVRTYQEDFGHHQKKDILDKIILNTRKANGASPYIIVDGKDRLNFGEITADVAEVKIDKAVTGNYFEFGVAGHADGRQPILKEIEVPNVSINRNYD